MPSMKAPPDCPGHNMCGAANPLLRFLNIALPENRRAVRYEPKMGDWLECEHGGGCCWHRWDGVESLEEGNGRHALTVLSWPPVNEKEVPPSAAVLSRALFESDDRVLAFVLTVCDGKSTSQAMRTAWLRNEGGWRSDAVRRADLTLSIMALHKIPCT